MSLPINSEDNTGTSDAMSSITTTLNGTHLEHLTADASSSAAHTNGHLTNGENGSPSQQDEADEAQQSRCHSENTSAICSLADSRPTELFQLIVELPNDSGSKIEITVTPQEQVQEIRQAIQDSASGLQYNCFHLEHKRNRVNDYIELSEIPDIIDDPNFKLVEDPYTNRDARLHLLRVRDLLAINGRGEVGIALASGASLFEHVQANQWLPPGPANNPNNWGPRKPLTTEEFVNEPFPWDTKPDHRLLLDPNAPVLPKALKSLSLSQWDPPPAPLRQRGYHLFLQLVVNEGQTYHITSHVSGFWVNRSTDTHFDPLPEALGRTSERTHCSCF